jgi:hypothetical protein
VYTNSTNQACEIQMGKGSLDFSKLPSLSYAGKASTCQIITLLTR